MQKPVDMPAEDALLPLRVIAACSLGSFLDQPQFVETVRKIDFSFLSIM